MPTLWQSRINFIKCLSMSFQRCVNVLLANIFGFPEKLSWCWQYTISCVNIVKSYKLLHGDHKNRFEYEFYSSGLTLVQSQNKLRIFLSATDVINLAYWLLPILSNILIFSEPLIFTMLCAMLMYTLKCNAFSLPGLLECLNWEFSDFFSLL